MGSPAYEVKAALDDLEATIAQETTSGAVDAVVADRIISEVVDALVVRGVDWLVPTMPDLDVAALYESAAGELPAAAPEPKVSPRPAQPGDEPGQPWWKGLAPLEVEGPDGGHRIRWNEGRLTLADHPDPEAEQTLGALGGARCQCLGVLEAWAACHENGAFLIAGPRNAEEVLHPPVEAIDRLTDDLARWRMAYADRAADARAAHDARVLDRLRVTLVPVERAATRRLGFLHLLGTDRRLQYRLVGSVAAALAATTPRAPALESALDARAPDGGSSLASTWLSEVWCHAVDGGGKSRLASGVVQWETRPPPSAEGAT